MTLWISSFYKCLCDTEKKDGNKKWRGREGNDCVYGCVALRTKEHLHSINKRKLPKYFFVKNIIEIIKRISKIIIIKKINLSIY